MAQPRPTSITVICILGFIGAALSIPLIFVASAAATGLPGWYTPFLAVSVVVGLACTIGMWKMKKWGALGYTAFTAINQVVLLVSGQWNVMSLIIPGIVVAIALSNLSKMD